MDKEKKNKEIKKLVKEDKLSLLFKSLISPGFLIVIVTAILGPYSVSSVNNRIKNKEIQTKIVEKVLDYTDKTNFKDPESIKRMKLITQIVQENDDIFDLSFVGVDSVFESLVQESEYGIIVLLKDEIKNSDSIQVKLSGDLNISKDSLVITQEKLEQLKGEKQKVDKKNQKEIDRLANEIGKMENEEIKFSNGIANLQNKISVEKENSNVLDDKLSRAEEDKIVLSTKISEMNNEAEKFKSIISNNELSINELRENFKKLSNEYAKSIEDYKDLNQKYEELESDHIDSLKVLNDFKTMILTQKDTTLNKI